MKNLVKIATISTLALTGAFFAPSSNIVAHAENQPIVQNQAQETTLAVSGNASRQVSPDYAVLNLGLVTKGKTASEAKFNNDNIMNQLVAKLLSQGITKNNLATQNFSLNPDYIYNNNNESKISGYTVRNSISIKINNIDSVSKIIDLATSCNINEIDSLNFYNNQQQNIEDQLINEAVKDAHHRAEVMANALGMHIIGVKNVTMNPVNTIHNNHEFYARALASSTPIESGTMSLEKTVHITYILES